MVGMSARESSGRGLESGRRVGFRALKSLSTNRNKALNYYHQGLSAALSEDERNHGFSTSRIILPKLFLVITVLFGSPNRHLTCGNDEEQPGYGSRQREGTHWGKHEREHAAADIGVDG